MARKTTKPAVPATTIVASNPYKEIEDCFADYVRPDEYKNKPFDFLVVVAGRADSPGPRDPRWEYILDAGRNKIEQVLNGEGIGPGPHYFIFPDRWLVPAEAQAFGSKLFANPDAKKFERVYIVTHQPYIVGDCRREQCRIMTIKATE